MEMNRIFKDIETGELITESNLFDGYITNLKESPIDYKDVSFQDYIANSSTIVEVEKKSMKKYVVRCEKLERYVQEYECEAESPEEAAKLCRRQMVGDGDWYAYYAYDGDIEERIVSIDEVPDFPEIANELVKKNSLCRPLVRMNMTEEG